MHRFYVEEIANGFAKLNSEDAHHALKVLRLTPGQEVEAICRGDRFQAILRADAELEIGKALPSTEPALQITLFQGLPKADKMDWIVQKAVEIGICRIVPVAMGRCVAKLSAGDAEKKLLRWNRIAREAGKQSGRCRIPEVTSPISLRELPAMARELEACIVPWEETQGRGPRRFAKEHPGLHSLGILIGPEGGIAPEEIDALGNAFQPITLGPRILRTETAGLAAAAAMLALAGEMEGGS